MNDLPYYRLELDDYSAASFTSFNKYYFGTMEDIREFINALEADERTRKNHADLIAIFHRYEQGETDLQHNVAYRKVPFLVPAKVLYKMPAIYLDHQWEHTNLWGFPYYMRCRKAEAEHIWLQCEKQHYRCVKVRFTDLQFGTIVGEWDTVEDRFWGYPKILACEMPFTWNRLAEIEKELSPKDLPALLEKWGYQSEEDPNQLIPRTIALADKKAFEKQPDPEFSHFCDDIFGDG